MCLVILVTVVMMGLEVLSDSHIRELVLKSLYIYMRHT